MWSLIRDYAAAATDAERALVAAAGEATIARYTGTAFHTSYLLGSLAGILVSWPMLREPAFGRVAWFILVARGFHRLAQSSRDSAASDILEPSRRRTYSQPDARHLDGKPRDRMRRE